MYALTERKAEFAEFLIEKGADVNAVDNGQFSVVVLSSELSKLTRLHFYSNILSRNLKALFPLIAAFCSLPHRLSFACRKTAVGGRCGGRLLKLKWPHAIASGSFGRKYIYGKAIAGTLSME